LRSDRYIIGIFALPTGIVASSFTEGFQKKRALSQQKKSIICPYSGINIDQE